MAGTVTLKKTVRRDPPKPKVGKVGPHVIKTDRVPMGGFANPVPKRPTKSPAKTIRKAKPS